MEPRKHPLDLREDLRVVRVGPEEAEHLVEVVDRPGALEPRGLHLLEQGELPAPHAPPELRPDVHPGKGINPRP